MAGYLPHAAMTGMRSLASLGMPIAALHRFARNDKNA